MQLTSIFFELVGTQDNVAEHIKSRVLLKFNDNKFSFSVQGSLSEKNELELIIPKVNFFGKPFPVFGPNEDFKTHLNEKVANAWTFLNKNVDELLYTKRYEIRDGKLFTRDKV